MGVAVDKRVHAWAQRVIQLSISPQAKDEIDRGIIGRGMTSYKVLRHLARGGYGSIFLVEHKTEKCKYVMKKLSLSRADDYARWRMQNEVYLHSHMRHPNIVTFKEAFLHDGCFLVVIMEYCEGGDLFTRLRTLANPKLKTYDGKVHDIHPSENLVVTWFKQLCDAIECCHRNRIIHCDIKPENIYLTNDGVLKLGDFGLAVRLKEGETQSCVSHGTLRTMPPELFDSLPNSFAGDVWSVGCVLFEMLSLKPAFADRFGAEGVDVQVYKKRVLKAKLGKIPTKYSKELSEICERMFQKDPLQRITMSGVVALEFLQEHNTTDDTIINMRTARRRVSMRSQLPAQAKVKRPARPKTSTGIRGGAERLRNGCNARMGTHGMSSSDDDDNDNEINMASRDAVGARPRRRERARSAPVSRRTRGARVSPAAGVRDSNQRTLASTAIATTTSTAAPVNTRRTTTTTTTRGPSSPYRSKTSIGAYAQATEVPGTRLLIRAQVR